MPPFVAVILLALAACLPAAAASIDPAAEMLRLAEHIDVFEDVDGRLGFAEVSSAGLAG